MPRPRPSPDNPESIKAAAARLKALRKAMSLTQGDIAASIGTGSGGQIWSNWERGYRRISVDHALVLCRRYGVTPCAS